jgi:hypothetical protein
LPFGTLSSSLRPLEDIDDIVKKAIRIDASLDAVEGERGIWDPGFDA